MEENAASQLHSRVATSSFHPPPRMNSVLTARIMQCCEYTPPLPFFPLPFLPSLSSPLPSPPLPSPPLPLPLPPSAGRLPVPASGSLPESSPVPPQRAGLSPHHQSEGRRRPLPPAQPLDPEAGERVPPVPPARALPAAGDGDPPADATGAVC